MKLLLIQFIQFEFSSEMRRNPTVRVFEAFFIRYGVNTDNCMRYLSLTLFQKLFTENNGSVNQRNRDENRLNLSSIHVAPSESDVAQVSL